MKEAQEKIKADPNYAANVWIEMDVKNFTHEEALSIIQKPDMIWDAAPQNTLTFLKHMNKVGLVKRTTDNWKDVYFPEIGNLKGS